MSSETPVSPVLDPPKSPAPLAEPGVLARVKRHVRLSVRARGRAEPETPPFLILFINSICNLTCEHCFYWKNLNSRNDLSLEELEKLSRELGPIDNLNLSGGEPFIRPDFAEVVRLFVRNNGVKQVYCPSSGYFKEKTEKSLRLLLQERDLQLFAIELSLDGMPEYHDLFRGNPKSFEKAMETYEMLAALQKEDPRLRIHSIATVTNENVEEIHRLTDFLHERCPAMDHHNIAVIRGDRKKASLKTPPIEEYRKLYEHVRRRWHDREKGRYGAVVEPMLQWAKIQTLQQERQVVPCTAGIMTGVVYANGDVSLCEIHEPLGNLRQGSFREIWNSPKAKDLRQRIANKECWCTTEVFLWPSIVFQPVSLARAAVGARVWETPSA